MEMQIGVEVKVAKSSYSHLPAQTGSSGVVKDYIPKAKLVEVEASDGSLWMFYEHELQVI